MSHRNLSAAEIQVLEARGAGTAHLLFRRPVDQLATIMQLLISFA